MSQMGWRIADEQDVLRELTPFEADVVLTFSNGERDAVIRVRQKPLSSSFLARLSVKPGRG